MVLYTVRPLCCILCHRIDLLQSAWFRPHNVSEDVDGLYLVGAGTHPGAGIPGVISSAKILDELVPPAARFRGGSRS